MWHLYTTSECLPSASYLAACVYGGVVWTDYAAQNRVCVAMQRANGLHVW